MTSPAFAFCVNAALIVIPRLGRGAYSIEFLRGRHILHVDIKRLCFFCVDLFEQISSGIQLKIHCLRDYPKAFFQVVLDREAIRNDSTFSSAEREMRTIGSCQFHRLIEFGSLSTHISMLPVRPAMFDRRSDKDSSSRLDLRSLR